MKQSPLSFYELSIREVALAIEGHNQAIERDYHLNFLAMYNAQGMMNGGKKFKVLDPFENKANSKKKPTKEERDETLAFIKQKVGEM